MKYNVKLNENKIENENDKNNAHNKPKGRRKSALLRQIFELDSFVSFKSKLTDISELLVQ